MPERTGRTGEPHERAAAEAARREGDSAAEPEPEPVEARPAAGMRLPDPPDVLAVRADRLHGELHERAAAEAARREGDSAAEPEPVEARPAAGMRLPDPPDVLAVRADRILGRGGPSPSAVVADIHREAMNLPDADERIIDLPHELQAWSFCPAGSGPGPRSPGSSSGREPHKRDVHLRIPKAAGETAAS